MSIDETETSDDVCTTPPMSEVNIMIPRKENDVIQGFIEPMVPSHQTQTCRHEFESTMTPAQDVENYSLKVPHPYMSLMRKVEQHTPPSLTSTTGDTTVESIKNTNEDSSYDGESSLDDDLHHLHVTNGDPLYKNTDDIDTLFSVIDAIRIPEDPNGLGETPSSSSVPTAKVVAAFDEPKNIVLRNNLRETLDENTKPKILHLWEILAGFDLSETQSGPVRRVKELLAFALEFSDIHEEDSLYKIEDV